jgi:integrase
MKSRLDAKVAELCRAQGQQPIEAWTLHDLRRTYATELGSLGVGRFVIERVLNHADAGVTSGYDRHDYAQAKREALEKWARRLRDLVEPPPDNVATFPLRVAG